MKMLDNALNFIYSKSNDMRQKQSEITKYKTNFFKTKSEKEEIQYELSSYKEVYGDIKFANDDETILHEYDEDYNIIKELMDKDNGRNFSGDQLNAIRYDMSNNLRIIAAAGSGKTQTICAKAAYMVYKNVASPKQIIMCTFTKKASLEMKERVNTYLNCNDSVKVYTFHSWFMNEEKEIRKKRNISHGVDGEINDDECKKLLNDLVSKYKLKEFNDYGEKVIDERLSYWVNINYSDDDIIDAIKKHYDDKKMHKKVLSEVFSQFLAEFRKIKEERKIKSFDDALVSLKNILLNDSEILNEIQNKYKYIFIDEYQDINPLQESIISLIAPPGGKTKLIIVGDDDQSIYNFRGSDPKYIKTFNHRYKEDTLELMTNYRSKSDIVQAANNLIHNNKHDRVSKVMKPFHKSKKNNININGLRSLSEEDDFIIRELGKIAISTAEEIDEKIVPNYKDILILYSKVNNVRSLCQKLDEEGVPYVMDPKKISEVGALGIKRFYYFYWALSNAIDDGAKVDNLLIHYMKLYFIKFYDINKFVASNDVRDTRCVVNYFKSQGKLNGRTCADIEKDYEYLCNINDASKIDFQYISDIFINAPVIKSELDNADKEFLDKELSKISNVDQFKKMNSTKAKIDEMKIKMEKYNKGNFNAVHVLTIHASKGLAGETVFVKSVYKRSLPHKDSVCKDSLNHESICQQGEPVSTIEEQRRLMYVAITRAKKSLYITYPTSYNNRPTENSLFIKELNLT